MFDEIHSNDWIFAFKIRSCQNQTDSQRTQTGRCQAVDGNKYCIFCMKSCLLFCNESGYGNRFELSPQNNCAQSSNECGVPYCLALPPALVQKAHPREGLNPLIRTRLRKGQKSNALISSSCTKFDGEPSCLAKGNENTELRVMSSKIERNYQFFHQLLRRFPQSIDELKPRK